MIVNHLNSRDIYHRDLKPENFMIKTDLNGRIYLHLSDFGLAKNFNPDYTPKAWVLLIIQFLDLLLPVFMGVNRLPRGEEYPRPALRNYRSNFQLLRSV